MEKNKKSKIGMLLGLAVGAVILSSCASNFCSNIDRANMAYPYEQGVTVYVNSQAEAEEAGYTGDLVWKPYADNDNLWAYIPFDAAGGFSANKASFLNEIIKSAKTNSYTVPSQLFFKEMDQIVLDKVIQAASLDDATITTSTVTAKQLNAYQIKDGAEAKYYLAADAVKETEAVEINENSLFRSYGYVKFYSSNDKNELWLNYETWIDEIRLKIGVELCPTNDFYNLYKNQINSKVNSQRSCITTREGRYGHYGSGTDWTVPITVKTWGDAWGKGLIEGLIEYPIAWLVDTMAFSFDPVLSGTGQVFAIILVTIMVRLLVMAATFKSTMDQQKMQALQPQLAKLQAKYPNSDKNQAEKQRLAQEQMALYKRNKINPASSLIAMIPQMIFFFGVWGALQGSAALSTGKFLNLRLSDTIQSVLFNVQAQGWAVNATGWWTALVLFILMAGFQFFSMKLPQWITKWRTKGIAKTTANPAADKSQRTMKTVTWVMLIFTIVMGFFLPSAMGMYWLIGAVMSIVQTLITQFIVIKRMNIKKKSNVIDYTNK